MLALGVCFGGKWDPHRRAGLTAYLQDVAALEIVQGHLGEEGSFVHRRKLLLKEFK